MCGGLPAASCAHSSRPCSRTVASHNESPASPSARHVTHIAGAPAANCEPRAGVEQRSDRAEGARSHDVAGTRCNQAGALACAGRGRSTIAALHATIVFGARMRTVMTGAGPMAREGRALGPDVPAVAARIGHRSSCLDVNRSVGRRLACWREAAGSAGARVNAGSRDCARSNAPHVGDSGTQEGHRLLQHAAVQVLSVGRIP